MQSAGVQTDERPVIYTIQTQWMTMVHAVRRQNLNLLRWQLLNDSKR